MTRDERAILVGIMTGAIRYSNSTFNSQRKKAISRLIRRGLVETVRTGYRWSHSRMTCYRLTDAGSRVAIATHRRLPPPRPRYHVRDHQKPTSKLTMVIDRYDQFVFPDAHD